MKIVVKNRSKPELPACSTDSSAGIDLRANIVNDIILNPMERTLVKPGFYLEIPGGYEAPIRPMSDLTNNKGISILNVPGTITADYRGEVGIILINLSSEKFVIKDGEKICKLVNTKQEKAEWVRVDNLLGTE
jgi:dUTP pyrophosphatase